MQLTIKELVEMIENNKIHYDQTTQRSFIYNTLTKNTADGLITRAGNVIRSIIQDKIQLPALFFWENDDGSYNVHDGKQRLLSIYYFLKPSVNCEVVTRFYGKELGCNGLDPDLLKQIYNYKFDIVVKKGSKQLEEKSFYLINTNSVPLTDYESLRGMFYGSWIYEFEKYINEKSRTFDVVKRIDRGEQAILFILDCFNLLGDTNGIDRLREFLRNVRSTHFDYERYNIDKKIEFFSELKNATKGVKIKEETLLRISSLVVKNEWNIKKIVEYYREISRNKNDISKWKYETHKVAISKLILNNVKCDGKRFFTDDDKSMLYEKSQRCSFPKCNITKFNELEVDHIDPWSKGGRTIIDNACLLCKKHNASKGADSDGEKSYK